MQPPNQLIYITRLGHRFGPYTVEQCSHMIGSGQLIPGDLAWRQGMGDWRPLGEVIPNTFQLSSVPMVPLNSQINTTAIPEEETAAQLIGQMGCGCVLWIGLLVLAVGGGVIFPVLLILLPIALIGGIIDMVKKLIRLSKRNQR